MGVDKKSDGRSLAASSRFDWSDVRVFLEVAEQRSLSAAAKSLQMAQPTVSQRIGELELRLNTKLFTRSAAGVALTEAGERLRKSALPMKRAASTIDKALREFDDRPAGRVRIAAPDGILSYWLAPRLPEFQRVNPEITISADAGLWPNRPVRAELDVSLQYDPPNFAEHVVEPLATVHYMPFASQRYVDRYGKPHTLAEFATHRTIHHAAVQEQKETWDPKAEAARTLSDYSIETNSSAVVAMSILAGSGVAFMPTFVAAYFDGLVPLTEEPAASPVLYLVYDPRLSEVSRAALVIAWIKRLFDPLTHPYFATDFVHPRDFHFGGDAGCLKFDPPREA